MEVVPTFAVNESAPIKLQSYPSHGRPLEYGKFEEVKVLTEFASWLEKHGCDALTDPASAVGVEINYNTSLRASGKSRASFRIVARWNISAGAVFLRVPLHLAITSDLGFADLSAPKQELKNLWDASALAAWLLRERAKMAESSWAPYIQSLPQFIPSPLLFPDDLLAVSEYELLRNETAALRREVREQYALLSDAQRASANESEFLWAFFTVTSRMYRLPETPWLPRYPLPEAAAPQDGGIGGGDVAPTPEKKEAAEALSWEEEFLVDAGEEEGEEGGEKEVRRTGPERGTKQPEGRRVISLVPLADLFDVDENSSATWKVQGRFLEFQARRDIAAGDPIHLPLDPSQNENHFIQMGFVPPHNPHDGSLIFSQRWEAITFFRKHFFAGERTTEQVRFALDDTFDIAEEFLELELEKLRWSKLPKDLPEFFVQRGATIAMFAWSGGRVDPRLLAGLAGCYSILVQNQTPAYQELVIAAAEYGWITKDKLSCDSFAAWIVEKESDSFPVAGNAVRMRVEELLKNFSSTPEQDAIALHAFGVCKELALYNRTSSGMDLQVPAEELKLELCSPLLMQHLGELEMLFRFRMNKKIILQQLQARLFKTCEMD